MTSSNGPRERSIAELQAALQAANDRRARVEYAALAVTATALALLAFAGYGLADYLVRFPWPIRVLLVIALVWAAVVLVRRAARRRLNWGRSLEEVARAIEQRQVQAQDSQYSLLISALQFTRQPQTPGAPELKAEAVRIAGTDGVDPRTVALYHPGRVREMLCWGAAAAVVYLVWCGAALPQFEVFVVRSIGLNAMYPTRTRVTEVEWQRAAPAREDYPIRVQAAGELPTTGGLTIYPAQGRSYEVELAAGEPGSYAATVLAPEDPFQFRIRLGDYVSSRYAVEIRTPPEVAEGVITVTPPEYLKLPPHDEKLGNLGVPEGSRVAFRVVANRPAASADLMRGTEGKPFAAQESRAFQLPLAEPLVASFEYSIRLRDDVGIENRRRTTYTLRVVPDQPPTVVIESPRPNTPVSPFSNLDLNITISDDHGLALVDGKAKVIFGYVAYQTRGENEVAVRRGELPLTATVTAPLKYQVKAILPIQSLQPAQGERLALQARAQDQRTGPANVGKSEEVSLTVVSAEELRVLFKNEEARLVTLMGNLREEEQRQSDAIRRRLEGSEK